METVEEYKAKLDSLVAADDEVGLADEVAFQRKELSGYDAKYAALREYAGHIEPEDSEKSQLIRTKLNMAHSAITDLNRKHRSFGSCPANWPEDNGPGGGE